MDVVASISLINTSAIHLAWPKISLVFTAIWF
jgi:hypothetical protein